MKRAIDSEKFYDFLTDQLVKETGAFSKGVNKGLNIARSALHNEQIAITLPAADVTEVRHGRWITPHWCNSVSCANCSECGFEAQHGEYRGVQRYYKLCPSCGASMKEAEHEAD